MVTRPHKGLDRRLHAGRTTAQGRLRHHLIGFNPLPHPHGDEGADHPRRRRRPTIVGFEVEQMIMPRLSGPMCRVMGIGDFDVMLYRHREDRGGSLLDTFWRRRCPCRT